MLLDNYYYYYFLISISILSIISLHEQFLTVFPVFIFTATESHIKPAASSGNQWRWRWSPEQCCYPHCCSRFSCPNPNSNSSPNYSSSSCSDSSPAHNRGTFFPFSSTARHLHHRDTCKCSHIYWWNTFLLALHIVLLQHVDFASICNLQLSVHAEYLPVFSFWLEYVYENYTSTFLFNLNLGHKVQTRMYVQSCENCQVLIAAFKWL